MNGNIEQQFIESEARDESIDRLESIDYAFDADGYQQRLEAQANKKAEKILKKNKREIARLKKHAENCIITNNFFGYSYAIKKLRGFYKQPYNDELIQMMWDTTRQSVLDIIESETKRLQSQQQN